MKRKEIRLSSIALLSEIGAKGDNVLYLFGDLNPGLLHERPKTKAVNH